VKCATQREDGQDWVVDLDSVADELYGLAPADFTEARDRAVKDARKAGDLVLAKSVSQLRKPTQAAWLANLLVRRDPGDVDGLLDLGEHLRAAQKALDGDEMRRLTQRRRTTIATLLKTVETLAGQHGAKLSSTVATDVEATLEAAVADPDAGEALRSGRLTTAMSYAGFGGVDLEGVVAAPVRRAARSAPPTKQEQEEEPAAPPPGRTRKKAAQGAAPAKRTTPKSDRTERLAEARADLEAVQQRCAAAEADLAAATETLEAAERRRTDVEAQIAALEREVAQVRREIVAARKERDRASKVAAALRRQQETAEVRVTVFEA